MLLFLIELAAKKQGYTILVNQKLENITKSTAPLFEINFQINNENKYNKNLFEVIGKRRTNRAFYKSLSENQFYQINEAVQKIISSFNITFVPKIPQKLINLMAQTEDYFWKNLKIQNDVFKWVRLKHTTYLKKNDGFYWRELGTGFMGFPFIFITIYCPKIGQTLYNIGLSYFIKLRFKNILATSGLICFSTKKNLEPKELINLGRAVMETWLWMTTLNVDIQPLSMQSLPIFYQKKCWLPEIFPRNSYNQLEDQYRSVFNLSVDENPVWVFRIGNARIGLPFEKMGLRKDLNEILTIK